MVALPHSLLYSTVPMEGVKCAGVPVAIFELMSQLRYSEKLQCHDDGMDSPNRHCH